MRPAIILVEPQLGENIGTAARAMANFGLCDLRLVTPRDGWPNEKARAAASRADHVIDAVRVYDDLASAVKDLSFIYATTARDRDLSKRVCGPVQAAATMRQFEGQGGRVGILFGRERWGLNNEEISLADEILTLPVDPEFASLNIAQAVLVISYEWRKAGFSEADGGIPFQTPERSLPATKDELVGLFEHLEGALDDVTFFRPPEKRPTMVRNLRAILQKAELNAQEVRTLRGVISALERRHLRPRDEKGNKPASAPKGDSEKQD
ncbi:RNA methyltransferase [Hartmannibacter diazotrophicus]|uniref:RNA methyltransferase n=1 Tax=Hartmannibacter diazotrophicus TaxID=1482074 RepID=UPI000C1494D5|nr:RNA methyltransferase [Hartmannibacter diazotrophicus]